MCKQKNLSGLIIFDGPAFAAVVQDSTVAYRRISHVYFISNNNCFLYSPTKHSTVTSIIG